jgi:hypothetical protein
MDRKSSKKMAATASRIMAMAQHGGPVKHFEQQIREKFGELPVDTLFLAHVDEVLRPFIDDAESLAASVLSQRAK